jgi:uncharacterized membrane protein (UPF0127 family)
MVIQINDNNIKIKIVTTSKDISRGMMGKRFNDEFDGLLFLLESGQHAFWMKNCIIPLDIIFIDENLITKIHHNCKPCIDDDCRNYTGYGNMVLELRGNKCNVLNIKEGDKIKIVNYGNIKNRR